MDVVTNADGWVAIKHRNSNPYRVVISADKTSYDFSTSPDGKTVYCNYLAMAWVRPVHVPLILGLRGRICCGNSGQLFFPANALDVSLWTTGKRP